MATTTPNLGLCKPELVDNFNLQTHLNDNWDKIDSNATSTSTAITRKLDKPVTDGTNGQILSRKADGTTEWIDKPTGSGTAYDDTEIRQEIATKQDALTAGTNITIENNVISAAGGSGSITMDSAMSDTSENAVQNKVIKEYIDTNNSIAYDHSLEQLTINSEKSEDDEAVYVDLKLEVGAISVVGNNDASLNTRARSSDIVELKKGTHILCESDLKYRVATYDSKKAFIVFLNAFTSENFVIEEDCNARLLIGYADGRKIDSTNIEDIKSKIKALSTIPPAIDVSKINNHQIKDSYARQQLSNLGVFDMSGMNVAIIGDSISTNGNSGTDCNVVEMKIESADVGVELSAYPTYYDVQAKLAVGGHTFTSAEIGTEVIFTPTTEDVGKVIGLSNNFFDNSIKVWWEVAKESLNFNAIPVCWSGSSITSHTDNTTAYKGSYAWHDSQIRKCGIRKSGTMTRTAPDVVIIYRGTNDMTHSPYTKLTENYFDDVNFEYPVTDVVDSGYGYKEGLVLTIKKLRQAYPNAKIILCTMNVFKRVNYATFPTDNGLNTLPQYSKAIREVADYMSCGVINFDKDGITFENCYSEGYLSADSGTPTHPTEKGHAVMGKQAVKDLINQLTI